MNKLTAQEIYALATPIWRNMNACSNRKDYDGFSQGFSVELKKALRKERFIQQREQHRLLTTLDLDAKPLACFRRKESVGVVFRQRSTELNGEFMGHLVLSKNNDEIKVLDASIY